MCEIVTKNGIKEVVSCDRAALRTLIFVRPSVCLSVRLSVCHTLFTMFLSSYHHEIVRSYYHWQKWTDVHAKDQDQRSRVKVTEVNTQFSRFRTVTHVWIHIWWRNDTQSLMRRTVGEVPYCFSRSSVKFQGNTGQKISDFGPNLAFPDCNSSLIWYDA